MKASGARTYQVAGLYVATVLVFGLIALAIGIPLGLWAGRLYAAFTAKLLNFTITSDEVRQWVYLVQVLVGLSVPLLATALPILRGSRITVREAISDYGIGEAQFGTNVIDRLMVRVRGLSRPLLLSLRNTFRRRLRLILTIGILAAGGATFISALNVGASWTYTLDSTFNSRHYDMEVRFTQPYPAAQVDPLVRNVLGVVKEESWTQL